MRCDQVGLSGSDGENRSTVVPHRLLLSIGRHSAIGGWRNLGVPPSSGGYPHPLTAFFGFFIGRRLLFHLMLGWQLIESTGNDLKTKYDVSTNEIEFEQNCSTSRR